MKIEIIEKTIDVNDYEFGINEIKLSEDISIKVDLSIHRIKVVDCTKPKNVDLRLKILPFNSERVREFIDNLPNKQI